MRIKKHDWIYILLSIVDKCANCHINAECIYGRCRCMKGYIGTGYVCEKGKRQLCIVVCFSCINTIPYIQQGQTTS